MKLVKLSLLFAMIAIVAAFPQKITKVNRPYVLIDINANSGISVGNKLNVIRQIGPGQTKDIGKVEIVVFKQGKCAGKIISETSSYPIRVGDQIQITQAATSTSVTRKPAYKSASYQPQNSYLPAYLAIGAGIASLGISYYYWDQAEKSAKDYDAMSVSNKKINYYGTVQDLQKYDNLSNSFKVAGGSLIVVGIAYYIWNRTTGSSSLSSNIQLQPQYASNYTGMGLSFNFNHPKN